jgi:DNA-binding NarL/FixJ family response regulator
MKNIIIADDHPFTLLGTQTAVENLGYRVVETCQNGIIALNTILAIAPDLALLDVNMPGLTGLEICEELQTKRSQTKVVLITMHNERAVYLKAQEYGVSAYLLKEYAATEIEACLQMVLSGRKYVSKHLAGNLSTETAAENSSDKMSLLSRAERKIVQLIAQEYNTKAIAEKLFISERTVEGHRNNIIRKLELGKDKNALLFWASKNI